MVFRNWHCWPALLLLLAVAGSLPADPEGAEGEPQPAPAAAGPDPELTAGQHLLALAEELLVAGRRDEAEAAYRKALESDEQQVRDEAFEELKSLVEPAGFWQRFLGGRLPALAAKALDSLVLVALPAILIACLAWSTRRLIRGLRAAGASGAVLLDVRPLSGKSADLYGSLFQEIVEQMHAKMQYHFSKKRGIVTISRFEISVRSKVFAASLGEMLTQLAPKAWPVFDRILRYVLEPDRVVEGALETADGTHHAVVRLKHSGKLHRSWEKSFPSNATIEGFKDLAYEILLDVKNEG